MADGNPRITERSVMSQYRELLDMEEADIVSRQGSLQERLDEMQQLYRSMPLDRAVAEVDGAALERLATLQRRQTEGYRVSLAAFKPLDFADRLAAALEKDPTPSEAWACLGQASMWFFPPAPRCKLPPPGAAPARLLRARAPRAARAPLAPAVTPTRVVDAERMDATRHQVNRLYSVLKGLQQRAHRPIGFFEFAYHPTDFGVTVENVFHTSVLVREQLARVRLDGDGLPVIEPLAKTTLDDAQLSRAGAAAPFHQVLLQVDHGSWWRVVAEFDIRRPLIPPASESDAAPPNERQP